MLRKLQLLIILVALTGFSALNAQTQSQAAKLNQMASEFENKWQNERAAAIQKAQEIGIPVRQVRPNGQVIELQRFQNGFPVYYKTHNINAAKTSSTDELWPGGIAGYSLTGSTETLGVWDGGQTRTTHQEFGGRVTQQDGATTLSDHATHVSGTIVAEGVDPGAKGMAYEATLDAYDWNSDDSEMTTAAANGLRVSNHSYGQVHGWEYDSDDAIWKWYGDTTISRTQDYQLGYYSTGAKNWDDIAFNAPNYLIVKSAGNDQGQGPGTQPVKHVVWNSSSGQWDTTSTVRELDGGSDSYQSLGEKATSKNILTVGAVHDITSGYSSASDVNMTAFSSWGPTDDGRIKPDIVANGQDLYSSSDSSDTFYNIKSGTSMSSPAVTGSIGLLQELYRNLYGSTAPWATTMKALVIHTADEAGANEGPDYQHGWGLMNTRSAAELMYKDFDDPVHTHIQELTLNESETYERTVYSNGNEPLRATIVWADPSGTPPSAQLDPTDKMLVNDLDIRLVYENGQETRPYVLDGANPANAATKADNDTDNVEQVYIDVPSEGEYIVRVSHKGTLTNSSQDFSLVVSGNNTTPGHLSFTGNGYMEVPNNPSIDITGNAITVEFWLKFDPAADTDAVLISKKETNSDGYQISLVGDGENRRIKFTPTWRSGLNLTSVQGIRADNWTHVAAVYDAGRTQLYINGELDSETEDSDTNLNSTALNFIVGSNHSKNAQFYKGQIDNIRIFSRAKTLFEIQGDFASEATGNESNLNAFYKFNVGASDAVIDYAGNGNNGSLVNNVAKAETNVFPLTPLIYGEISDSENLVNIYQREYATENIGEVRLFRYFQGSRVQVSSQTNPSFPVTLSDDNVLNGTSYKYQVTVVDNNGNQSDYSNTIGLTPSTQSGGTSIHFADQGYLDFGYNPSLDVDGRHLTVMFWIKRENVNTGDVQTILGNKNDGSDGYHIYLDGSGEETYLTADMTWRSGLNVTTNSGIRAGEWTHVTVVYNDGSTHIYLNGVLDAETSDSQTALGSRLDNRFIIGSNQARNGQFFRGQLDELRIYDISRPVEDIEDDYNILLEGNEPGLAGYFRFDRSSDGIIESQAHRPATATPVGSPNAFIHNKPGAIPLPPMLYAMPDSGEVKLSLDTRVSGTGSITDFNIYRKEVGGTRQLLTTLPSSTTDYMDSSVQDSISYVYEATVVKSNGSESDFDYPVQATLYNDQPAGQAVRFETNENAYIQHEFNPELDIAGNQMTVEVWVKKDAVSQSGAFIVGNKSDGSDGYRLNFADAGDSSRVTFNVTWRSGLNVTSNVYLQPGQWYHIAGVYDEGNTRIYINGALDNSTGDSNTSVGLNDNPIVIGANNEGTADYFIGEVDELRIFNQAIDQTVIANRYNQPLMGNEPGLVGYWRYDELDGQIAHSSAQRPLEGDLRNGAQFVPSSAMEGLPFVPLLVMPADSAVDQPRPLTFEWMPVNNAVHYELEVSEEPVFETVILKKEIPGTTTALETGLKYDSTYHWRVRAVTNQFATNWSDSRVFTMELPVPATPDWQPDNNATEVSTSPLLVWSESDRAKSYRVQLSEASDFSSVVLDSSGINETQLQVQQLEENTEYHWRVLATNRTGDSNWSESRTFETTMGTSLEDETMITDYELSQNYPNPFNPSTNIQYALPEASEVRLEVYNLLGERVAVLVDGTRQSQGRHQVTFNAENLSSGVYLYKIRAANYQEIKKMILIK